MLNAGEAGPGGVDHCICRNAGASDAKTSGRRLADAVGREWSLGLTWLTTSITD